jgi:hypothetical protein
MTSGLSVAKFFVCRLDKQTNNLAHCLIVSPPQDEATSEMQQQMMRDDKHKVHIFNEVLDKQPSFKQTKGSE